MRIELAWWDLGAGDPDPDALAASPVIQQAFAEWEPDSRRARDFVRLEDWANDGPPLPEAAARESARSWTGPSLTGSMGTSRRNQPTNSAVRSSGISTSCTTRSRGSRPRRASIRAMTWRRFSKATIFQ